MEEKDRMPIPPPPPAVRKEAEESRFVNNRIGVPPPQAVDLEKVVIGAFLIDYGTKVYIDLLEPEVFFEHKHVVIFEAMQNLHTEGKAIDILTIVEELRRIGKLTQAGSEYYIIQLTQLVSSAAHIDFHLHILLQKYVLRELIKMSDNTIGQALHHDPDIFDLIDDIESKLARIENVAMRRKADQSNDAKQEMREKVEMQRNGITPGVPTGIHEFDHWCGGFRKRWLVTLAARPGMGKTSAIVSIIYHMVFEKGIKVCFFSLEMKAIDIKNRLAARLTEISFDRIDKGLLTDEELDKYNASIDAIDASNLTLLDDVKNLDKIVSETRKQVREGTKIFFLDYVQLVEVSGNRDETGKLTEVTRTLKSLKNELDIPFIQLAQLSREVEKRSDKRPMLSDLKMSGSIEEDSNMVIFILRPEYYNKNKSKVPVPPGQQNPEFVGEWIVAKGRDTGVRDFDIYIDFLKMNLETLSGIQF